MSPLVYLHDGSFEGLLHSVAAAVKCGKAVGGIYPAAGHVRTLFDQYLVVETDPLQAERLLGYLQGVSGAAVFFAINGYLSEDPEIGIHLYHFVRLCLARGSAAVELYSDDSVRYLDGLCRKVNFEAHRLTGLIRFRMLADQLQYGPFESDHNVIGYLASHFRERFSNRRWMLHDIGRNFALYWDGKTLNPAEVDGRITGHVSKYGELPKDQISEDERYYQQLWRSFHTTAANPDRENRLLQRQYMPRRYWKYLIEMQS